jgi:hypothetical protein
MRKRHGLQTRAISACLIENDITHVLIIHIGPARFFISRVYFYGLGRNTTASVTNKQVYKKHHRTCTYSHVRSNVLIAPKLLIFKKAFGG